MTLAELAARLGAGRQRAAAAAAVPAVEAVLVWRIGWSAALAAFMYLGALGVVASVIDLRTHRLPHRYLDSGVHHLAEARAYRWEFRPATPLRAVTPVRLPS